MFVVDDLLAWLVGLVADAGRKKLVTLVLGTDQERALRPAVEAAVAASAAQLAPSKEQADQLATAIGEVFHGAPKVALAGQGTLLEALQAGIATRLAVLDDPDATGTGRSTLQLLGVPAGVLAQRLAGHLVHEITVRGAQGGPLAPLADQLNHDMTHLQDQRLEGMLAQVTATGVAAAGSGTAIGHVALEDAVSRAVREAVKPGLLAFNPPEEMSQGRKERIEVGIANSPELHEALLAGLRGHAEVQFEEVPTSAVMGVELRGAAFEIVSFSPLEQVVAPTARWEFDVIPLRAGVRTLTLCVSMRIEPLQRAMAVAGRIAVPVLERQIRIHVNVSYGTRHFLARNWQWIIGTAVAVGAAIATWVAVLH